MTQPRTAPRRIDRRRAFATPIAAIAATALLAACGGSSSGGSSGLTVNPSDPHPGDQLTFSFKAPVAAGVVGKTVDSFSLSVTGPGRVGCKGSGEAPGTPVGKGATERISIGPAQLHANWCVGPYTARVFELQRPYCKPGQVCPQYVRVAGIVARTSFTVKR